MAFKFCNFRFRFFSFYEIQIDDREILLIDIRMLRIRRIFNFKAFPH
ncbi:hypothetical protein LEP1GSC016_0444 [Leptospira borgpetersenii serovar Hardjo-bovis str. Sponselee]|uniref:Uncharacterized protein n=1 Tax=Leptospira borgpetersenii serovar Hardjo-bovis str. Sponselee TaxID=1303729 RepID=M6BZI6_LEPBO|nr:hypothetical protein LEP1GSC016_0444 [Leptospira borgpetersenii serovar Hardjo-bovis str. Sponselee]